ncbi:carboxymuconolactone decarboxylase family protein [Actinoplanes couchii]|uniref:Alkyl hydroperoxide reductase AhpD n=1 Tax=Actinoplanes couchii TaxID=403638 RepID=A0ABQ3XT96_9ACTN|nr:carboxymuconolactone decarboxylase family protein [Actinoplanes couchii]MDR6319968.1 putative peroxidase-related enzyme [Actinoplanes couchii]GID61650.1 alkyl hydroperoxide reductase AhpD [Actinoplanes couchii]
MSRIATVDPATAEGQARTLLGRVERALGTTPNMMRAMAASPAVLDAYLQFSGALSKGSLPGAVQEQIALVAAVENECGYCLAAHTVLGARAGVSEDDLAAGRDARASDPKAEAALVFAKAVIETKGFVTDGDLDKVRAAGYGDGEIGEIVAAVALNTFTNYFNSVGQTTLDFPPVAGVTLRD